MIETGYEKVRGKREGKQGIFPVLLMKAEMNVRTPPQAIRIRNLVIDPPLLLAPMAGLTHSALRRIMIGFGGVGLSVYRNALGKKTAH